MGSQDVSVGGGAGVLQHRLPAAVVAALGHARGGRLPEGHEAAGPLHWDASVVTDIVADLRLGIHVEGVAAHFGFEFLNPPIKSGRPFLSALQAQRMSVAVQLRGGG